MMFEKFTERSRKVISLARNAAQKLNQEFIGSEAILLGILDEGGSKAVKVLKCLGVGRKRIVAEIEKLIPPSPPSTVFGQLPFSPRAKEVLKYADEIAGTAPIGPEHILLAFFREKESILFQVLNSLAIMEVDVKQALGLPVNTGEQDRYHIKLLRASDALRWHGHAEEADALVLFVNLAVHEKITGNRELQEFVERFEKTGGMCDHCDTPEAHQ